MARRPKPVCPVPSRDGVAPTRIRCPRDESWPTLADFLTARFPPHDAAATSALFARGDVFGPDGGPLGADAPYAPGGHAWAFRPLPEEPTVPTDLPVLFEDEHLLAVDKPHGLPVTPRGAWVRNTAVTVLRRETGEDLISPAHRLDRLTAGVLLLARTREARGPLQALFETQRVRKSYELVAPLAPAEDAGRPSSSFPEVPRSPAAPLVVRSRLVREPGSLQTLEVPGPPNAVTGVRLLEELDDGWARYAAFPRTGRTHQIRVHLASLGRPIRHDPLYPRVLPPEQAPAEPLQLLARRLELVHPFTGEPLDLRSARTLGSVPGL